MEAEAVDGNPVVSHLVRFKDRVTITDEDATAVRDGAVVVWVVRTVCQPPSYHPTAKGTDDRYRFNIQSVKAAAVLHGDLRDGALAYLDDPTQAQGRFVFDAPTYNGDDQPAEIRTDLVFTETGTEWPPAILVHGSNEPVAVRPDGPLPNLPASAYPPGGTELDVSLLDDERLDEDDDAGGIRVAGSVYGEAGSDTQKLLQQWDEL